MTDNCGAALASPKCGAAPPETGQQSSPSTPAAGARAADFPRDDAGLPLEDLQASFSYNEV